MRKAIIHANVVLPDRLLQDGVCCFTDEKIDYIGNTVEGSVDEIIDANGAYLLPGFIDDDNNSDTYKQQCRQCFWLKTGALS